MNKSRTDFAHFMAIIPLSFGLVIAATFSGTTQAAEGSVIPPLIMFLKSRTFYAACSSFCIGVIPPFAILGRSLLYRHNHCVAVS